MQETWVWFLVPEDPTGVDLLSPCTTTIEAMSLQPVLHNKKSHCNEKSAHCNERGPCSPQLEKAHAATKTQHSQK